MKLSRITFTYGLLWEHENLTPLTHDTLHEFFGYITAECSAQLALTMREKKLVSASGKDIYLPDVDKDDRLDSPVYRKHINRLDMPICFIVGESYRMFIIKRLERQARHVFMETKTKVDALFDILFYIYHNNGNNTHTKNAYCKMHRIMWLGYYARGGARPSQSLFDSMCQFVQFLTQPSLINHSAFLAPFIVALCILHALDFGGTCV